MKSWAGDSEWPSEVIISDESCFGVFDESRRIWVQCDIYTDRMLRPTPKHNASFIVWGAIGRDFKSKLIFIEENLKADEYRVQKSSWPPIYFACDKDSNNLLI
jgi:hypothetical protein